MEKNNLLAPPEASTFQPARTASRTRFALLAVALANQALFPLDTWIACHANYGPPPIGTVFCAASLTVFVAAAQPWPRALDRVVLRDRFFAVFYPLAMLLAAAPFVLSTPAATFLRPLEVTWASIVVPRLNWAIVEAAAGNVPDFEIRPRGISSSLRARIPALAFYVLLKAAISGLMIYEMPSLWTLTAADARERTLAFLVYQAFAVLAYLICPKLWAAFMPRKLQALQTVIYSRSKGLLLAVSADASQADSSENLPAPASSWHRSTPSSENNMAASPDSDVYLRLPLRRVHEIVLLLAMPALGFWLLPAPVFHYLAAAAGPLHLVYLGTRLSQLRAPLPAGRLQWSRRLAAVAAAWAVLAVWKLPPGAGGVWAVMRGEPAKVEHEEHGLHFWGHEPDHASHFW